MTEYHPEGLPKRRLITGVFIAASAIGAMFSWGVHFHVFDSDIDLASHPEQMGLPILLAVAVFGCAYALSGLSVAIRKASGFCLLLAVAYLVGVVRRLFS